VINYDTQCHHMNTTEPLRCGYECRARPIGQTKFTRIQQVRNPHHRKKIMDWSYSETWRPLIDSCGILWLTERDKEDRLQILHSLMGGGHTDK